MSERKSGYEWEWVGMSVTLSKSLDLPVVSDDWSPSEWDVPTSFINLDNASDFKYFLIQDNIGHMQAMWNNFEIVPGHVVMCHKWFCVYRLKNKNRADEPNATVIVCIAYGIRSFYWPHGLICVHYLRFESYLNILSHIVSGMDISGLKSSKWNGKLVTQSYKIQFSCMWSCFYFVSCCCCLLCRDRCVLKKEISKPRFYVGQFDLVSK